MDVGSGEESVNDIMESSNKISSVDRNHDWSTSFLSGQPKWSSIVEKPAVKINHGSWATVCFQAYGPADMQMR